jgi:hypothetical protein
MCAACDRFSFCSYAYRLFGDQETWLNPTSSLLVKLAIGTDSTGRLFLHAYGACSPPRVDWGTVYPTVWSGSVDSGT